MRDVFWSLWRFAGTLFVASSTLAHAEVRDMQEVFATVTGAGLMEPFYAIASIEPPPSGATLLEDVILGDQLPYTHVGGDGAGGAFVRLADGALIYISSEGETAGLGDSIEELLAITLSMDSWMAALRFVRADAEADAKAWAAYRREWDLPERPAREAEAIDILALFGLTPLAAPFEHLHTRVSDPSSGVAVRDQHGAYTRFGQ